MTTAAKYTKHCPRCYRPISIGARIEPFGTVGGQKRWAHVGCRQLPGTEGISAATSNDVVQAMSAALANLGRANGNGSATATAPPPVEPDPEAFAENNPYEDEAEAIRQEVAAELSAVEAEAAGEALASAADLQRAVDRAVAAKLPELEKKIRWRVKKAIEQEAPTRITHVFQLPTGTTELTGEVLHPKFNRLLRLAIAGKPIFLPGPTGCGKTHTAIQLAKALHGDVWQERFGMLSCSPGMSEGQILGRSVPNIATGLEVYRCSEFVRIFEQGGVFLFDEMDAADPSVLLVINAALANGCVPVPNRPEKPLARKAENFVCVAAANTWGTGADRQYVGRNPLDEATLDRFRVGSVPCDYYEAIEKAVCPDAALYRLLKGWRDKMRSASVKRIISTRFFKDAYDMLQVGDTLEEIQAALFGGWKPEERAKVLTSV